VDDKHCCIEVRHLNLLENYHSITYRLVCVVVVFYSGDAMRDLQGIVPVGHATSSGSPDDAEHSCT
jgi:hypothetical protein